MISECDTGVMQEGSLLADLAQVIAQGGPAQRDEALLLAAVLSRVPEDADARSAACQLIDAYLNDPYLERG